MSEEKKQIKIEKKERKKRNRIIVNKREIELLNKYYEIDNENRIVTMPLHYEKASDLVNDKIISKDNYLFDYDELTSINEMIKRVPAMYRINIDIQIDDYEDYEPEKLIAGFNDALELNQYNYQRENKWKFLRAGILLIVGLTVLFLVAYAKLNKWFGTSDEADVYSEIFDIIGWVFIWETVTIAFLTPSELGVSSLLFRVRVGRIRFKDIDDKVLVEEVLASQTMKWENERRIEQMSKWSLLLSGIAFVAMGVLGLVTTITSLYEFYTVPDKTSAMVVSYLIIILLDLILVLLQALGGYCALARYIGKRILPKFSFVFSGIMLILIVASLILAIGDSRAVIKSLFDLAVLLLYLFGLISNIVISKRKQSLNDLISSETTDIKEEKTE